MGQGHKIAFAASEAESAQASLARLAKRYGSVALEEADVIVALGGDGFMLQTLHGTMHLDKPVYGMNRGTVGFLMNEFAEDDLLERLSAAEEAVINPLHDDGDLCRRHRVRGAGDQRGVAAARRTAGRQAADHRRRQGADGRTGLRRRAGRHAGRIDRLQLLGARADPADRRGCAGADRDGGVPAPALARRAAPEVGTGAVRRARAPKSAR